MRPIISQVTTPTYQVAKKLNSILTPYIPIGRSVKSATEFIDILHTTPACNNISSLDIESLFTNVPVDETINIILKRVYQSDQPKLDIPEQVLKALLETCTKEAPFFSHKGELFRQIDGVAMGSPLGVLFANMYMSEVEERTFKNHPPPGIYTRYIDDIFVSTTEDDQVPEMITNLQANSCLRFTSENSVDGRLPFLDVDITKRGDHFSTKVYTKPTNVGRCLNARGECPTAYKRSVAAAYVNRALTHCSSWMETHRELDRIRQLLTNNGYNDQLIEEVIKTKLEKYAAPGNETIGNQESIILYYQNSYHNNYKQECDAIKKIIRRGVLPTDASTTVKMRIYCKPNLTRSLFMRNSTAPRTPREATTNVVYKFNCMEGRCDGSNTYIGRTSTTLRRRLQYHRNQGSIFQHFTEVHNKKPPLQYLIENTSIIHKETNFRRLQISEAVSITCQRPTINAQQTMNFTLPSVRPLEPNQQQQHQGEPSAQQEVNALTNQRTRLSTRASTQTTRHEANQLTNENSDPTPRH